MNGAIHSRARIEGLDVLRGIAILLVMLRHSWPNVMPGGGIVGVVVFFTLSGYLITGLLVADLRNYGRVRYGRFYRNRAIRLLPALVLFIAVFIIVQGFFALDGKPEQVARAAIVGLTYTMNVPGFSHGHSDLSHLWTLANEEQFYLIWPLILAIGLRFRRLKLIVGICALLLLLGNWIWLALIAPDYWLVYPAITTWTISMIIGAAAQLGQRRIDNVLTSRRTTVGALIGFAGLTALALIPGAKDHVLVYAFGGIAIGLFTMLVIWKLREIPTVHVSLRPLLALGTISYAAYLWNYPLTQWLRNGGAEYWAPLAFTATIAAAAVSWYLIERPMNAWRTRLDRRAHLVSLDPVFAGDEDVAPSLEHDPADEPLPDATR